MVKAIVEQGQIHLTERLPTDWTDGQSVIVEKADDDSPSIEEIDRDFAALESMCATSSIEDEMRMDQAIAEARRQAKEEARRRMGI